LLIQSFNWDKKNEAHILRHKVTPDEAEEVFVDRFFYRRTGQGKYFGLGQTLDGRYLLVVFKKKTESRIRVVTARDMDAKELKFYKKWLGGKRQ